MGLSDKAKRGALWPEGLTIHSLEDVGAGVAATVHTRRLKAKSCNYSKQSLYLSERGEIGFARHESHSCYVRSPLGFANYRQRVYVRIWISVKLVAILRY